jgi:DNA-binding MarR family transcriptional regulator
MLPETLQYLRPTREYREMAVLAEIARGGTVSQRSLARAAGVSATMINAYVDNLVGRGLLDVTGETNRSYRYFLTAGGRERLDALFAGVARDVEALRRCVAAAPPPVHELHPPAPHAQSA